MIKMTMTGSAGISFHICVVTSTNLNRVCRFLLVLIIISSVVILERNQFITSLAYANEAISEFI